MNQMLSLESDSSAESSTTANQSARIRKRQMGVWLSLLPPGSHGCSLCNKRFRSLQAVGGHQNAHRKLRIQIQMQKMYMKILEEEEEKRRGTREGKRIKHSCSDTGAPVANDHGGEGEIDLDLRLGCGPPKKVMDLHEFMPVKRVKGHGVGAHSGSGVNYKINAQTQNRCMSPAAYGQSLLFPELPENPLRAGVNKGGVGVGCGGRFLKASVAADEPASADQCVGLLCGGRNAMKVASKTGLDVTLKL